MCVCVCVSDTNMYARKCVYIERSSVCVRVYVSDTNIYVRKCVHILMHIKEAVCMKLRTGGYLKERKKKRPECLSQMHGSQTYSRIHSLTNVHDKIRGGAVLNFNHPNKLTVTVTVTVTMMHTHGVGSGGRHDGGLASGQEVGHRSGVSIAVGLALGKLAGLLLASGTTSAAEGHPGLCNIYVCT